MARNFYPAPLQKVIRGLSRWPGIGEKTATRLALYLLRAADTEVTELAQALIDLKAKIRLCSRCFAFADQELCPICADPGRNNGQLVVVADPGDLIALERVGFFQGAYHVLGGLISPLDNVGPRDLHISELLSRLHSEAIEEVILALNPSLEGEATTAYLAQELQGKPVKVTRIAYGLPMGGDLKYADQQTIKESLRHRVRA
ncbi:recombination mediator RecR [Desulfobacca acetoxidans]|uniref:Recombination protein RecR n=1 Tax=Desulfobacca acetoxidans (strain ATCC 700848 / DSM 11109 / ASRB2) TaxID=880072 RepID=F2NDJ3_DESAR|nr:recombination mediator RecR [Desulfobacca acetoxidans]AEB10269.1 Recombination protein recR [Desulfobacca acetoxidans DSM 11109]